MWRTAGYSLSTSLITPDCIFRAYNCSDSIPTSSFPSRWSTFSWNTRTSVFLQPHQPSSIVHWTFSRTESTFTAVLNDFKFFLCWVQPIRFAKHGTNNQREEEKITEHTCNNRTKKTELWKRHKEKCDGTGCPIEKNVFLSFLILDLHTTNYKLHTCAQFCIATDDTSQACIMFTFPRLRHSRTKLLSILLTAGPMIVQHRGDVLW